MRRKAEDAGRRIRVVAALLIVGLAAGPVASHLYWMLGGTWGLHDDSTTGIRVVAAVVVLLLVAALLVVLAQSASGSRRSCPTAWFGFSPGRWRGSSSFMH